jgi:16S rRNA (guanine527-N7)-methyltransferase
LETERHRTRGSEPGSDFRVGIAAGAQLLGQVLSTAQVDKLAKLLEELERWNRRINLTAIRTIDEMVPGHILDSLAVRRKLRGKSVLDIGTGAGFPGLPLAIVEPGIEFVLLDSNGKKISFVREMIGVLGLSNAEAVKARAEDYAPGKRFDTVIARALASLPRLVEISAHLVEEDGQLLALKGKYPAEELDAIRSLPEWEYSVEPVDVPGLEAHVRHVVCLKRIKARS